MTLLQLLVLALVQGVSEFLPVSSSAHLVLVSEFTAWADQGLGFDAAVHAGTLTAVVVYFRDDLRSLLRAALRRDGDRRLRRLLAGLCIATVPVVLVGALASDWIQAWLRSPVLIAWTTIVFGVLLGIADRFARGARTAESLSLRDALLIGLAQVLALVPGTSRSGITITAGLALGLTRAEAARYSFLMSIPVIAAAGGWGFLTGLAEGGTFELGRFALAAGVAGVVAWITIAAFLAWLRRYGMAPFVVYRLVLGACLLAWAGAI